MNPIEEKLAGFIKQNKIPHILFHGPSGSGKRTLVYKFVEDIYNNDKQLLKNYTMFADCAHGKGIKFIREDLKFFAKTNINIQGSGHFKTIVLTNADKLTTDAQSALRRCIELFSHNTRFFIIVENKYNLLKPILSRLCDIFINGGHPHLPRLIISKEGENIIQSNGSSSGSTSTSTNSSGGSGGATPINNSGGSGSTSTPNYYKINIAKLLDTNSNDKLRSKYLENEFNKLHENNTIDNIVKVVNKLYQKGYSGLDLMNYIEGMNKDNDKDTNTDTNTDFLLKKYKLLMLFHKVKTEFRSEHLFMTFILSYFFVRSNSDLENLSFM